jgi:RimJ/RimL family protein N-acetyltransferase
MNQRLNSFDQPIGPEVDGWSRRPLPPITPMVGQYCRLEKLDADKHAAELYAAFAQAPDWRDWTYLPRGPFDTAADYAAYAHEAARSADPFHYAIIDAGTGKPLGTAAHMRIDPDNGVIEVGAITYAPALKRGKAGTEAMFLMMRRAFDELGYRRYEWKCDHLHAGSRRAAERYGFRFEGIFRQAIIYKGRSRDTAWYSITDREWPLIARAFGQWLSPDNFDADGIQRRPLAGFRP